MLIIALRTLHSFLSRKRKATFPNRNNEDFERSFNRFLIRLTTIVLFLCVVFASHWCWSVAVNSLWGNNPYSNGAPLSYEHISRQLASSGSTPTYSPTTYHSTNTTDHHNSTSTHHDDDDGHGTTTSHSSAAESSLFGIISELDPVIGTVAFIIIVAAVLFVEFLFGGLHVMAHDTPFQHLIPAVEKELMIAGCTAFVFKIIVNATNQGLSHKWLLGLEYAGKRKSVSICLFCLFMLIFFLSLDLVVPVFSFIYCALGIILIALSVHQCGIWSKAYHMKLLELLDDFFDYTETFRFRYFSFIPNKTIFEVEFRIFHNIFCDAYKIQRKAFAFDEYVNKVFEKFVMEIIEIRPWDWLLVSLLFMLNIIRLAASIHTGKKCESHDYDCKDVSLTAIFAIGGLLLFVLTVFIAFYSRYLELKIMKSKGIADIDGYYSYVHVSDLILFVCLCLKLIFFTCF
jgi:hypothetical protein